MTTTRSLPTLIALLALLCAAAAPTGCVGEVLETHAPWDDDDEADQRQTSFKHGPPSGAAPWTYTLTSYGGPSDGSAYKHTPGCGGKVVDGKWYYATGAWSFGCFTKLRITANNKCIVVDVVDNGPAAWVENKAKQRCGGTGYIIDASPLVSKHLFGQSSAGWSECLKIQVEPVASNTPSGPCSATAPAPTPAPGDCHTGPAFGWTHCSPSCPCDAGMGDCDSDADCKAGTVCKHNVGAKYGAGSTVDVCEASTVPVPQPKPTPSADAGAPSPSTCHGNEPPFGWNYCSPSCPCAAGEGDCDKDSDCQSGLVCAKDKGASYGVASTIDVCEAPAAPTPTPKPSTSCSYKGGSNFRRCNDCGWQFCLSSGKWSSACEPRPSVFPCASGTCRTDASCR